MAVVLPRVGRLSNGVGLNCREVGAAPRAALVVAAILRSRVSAFRSRVRTFLDASHLCTFARGRAAFAPFHIITRTRTRTGKPVPVTRPAET